MRSAIVCGGLLIALLCPVLTLADKNPADYPLKVVVLDQLWATHNVRYSEYRATGRGDVLEGGEIHGVDFEYECSFGLTRTALNQPYLAKWKKPKVRLELLAGQIGKDNKYETCELKTTVRDDVYIRTAAGGLVSISQEEYKRRHAERPAAATAATPASPAGAPLTKVSVTSEPDGAEIEVDGNFVGNTPATLDLPSGAHEVVATKPGFKPWQRKLNLVSGEVKLVATLTPEESK